MRRRTEFLTCRWLQSHHFILLMEFSAFTAFIAGYAISVGTDNIAPVFPYISDTGTTPPASCVFGLFLNLAAGFGTIAIVIRHRHLQGKNEHDHVHKLNDVSMFLGLLSCFGLMMVACFQWSEAGGPHLFGAFMVFILGGIYCWCQSVLTYKCTAIPTLKVVTITRVVLSCLGVAGLVLTVCFTSLANVELSKAGYNTTAFTWKQRLHWTSKYPGYSQHLLSVFSEWMMALAFLLFFATYYSDFKNLDVKVHVGLKNSAKPVRMSKNAIEHCQLQTF